tara:strand:+ start:15090 stop:15818 length:729 start_codon:yes stop_codon:yes gene_type:complete
MKRFTSPFRKEDWALGPILRTWLDRLEGAFQARSPENIASIIAGIEPGQVVMLAPDTWEVSAPIKIKRSCTLVGTGLGTKIRASKAFAGAALLEVTAENVVVKDISFDGNSRSIKGVKGTANGLSVFGCKFDNFTTGIEVSGGNGALVSTCYFLCTNSGVTLKGTSSSNRICENHIQVSGDDSSTNVGGIVMGNEVSLTSVTGNVSSKKIKFHNTGGAQSFAAPGNLGNHVAGNAAALAETT